MDESRPIGTDAWVSLISETELPALTSTVQRLESLSHDKSTSLAALGQVILHDHALTSKVLRVANSTRSGRNKVTTVSRATIILGIENVKSICITAKLLGGLLKNKNLSSSVYERLLRLMALSFQSAMLAKMMASKYDEETQEEIFIAALLHRIGETAFWSLGGATTEKLDQALKAKPEKADELVKHVTGTSFNDISLGLTKHWQYGEFLIKSFDEPEHRTKEMQIVHMADQLSYAIFAPEKSSVALPQLMQNAAEIMGTNLSQFKTKLTECAENTARQLSSYGATALLRFVKTDIKSAMQVELVDDDDIDLDKTAIQMEVLRELAQMAMEKVDFNQIIHTALEGVSRGLGFERTLVLLLDAEKHRLVTRFISANQPEVLRARFVLDLTDKDSVFTQAVRTKLPKLVNSSDVAKLNLPQPLMAIMCKKGFCLAPIVVGGRCIGLFYGDFADNNLPVSNEEFASFCHFVLQTNLALTVVTAK